MVVLIRARRIPSVYKVLQTGSCFHPFLGVIEKLLADKSAGTVWRYPSSSFGTHAFVPQQAGRPTVEMDAASSAIRTSGLNSSYKPGDLPSAPFAFYNSPAKPPGTSAGRVCPKFVWWRVGVWKLERETRRLAAEA